MNRPLLAVATLVASGSLVAVSSASGAASHARRATTIRVIEHADTDATTDTGKPGDSAGDILTFANPVFDRHNARQVGSDQGYCVRVVVGTSYECTWTTFLERGQIVVQGPFYDAKDSTLAVTGGTGRFRRARGTMRLHARPDGKSYVFAFRLR